MIAHGQDWEVKILLDGALQKTLRAPTSVSINFGLSVESEGHVGERVNRLHGINSDVRFDVPFQPESPEFLDLVMAQRRANDPNRERVELRIDCSAAVDFGREGRARVQFRRCIFHDADMAVQGRTGRTTGNASFTSSEVVRL